MSQTASSVKTHTNVVRMFREKLPEMTDLQRRLGVECTDEIAEGDILEYQDWREVDTPKGPVQRMLPIQQRVDKVEYTREQADHQYSTYPWYCMLHVTRIF